MSNDTIVTVRAKRPLSIWVLCIINGLLAAFLIASCIIAESRGYSGWQAAFVGIAGLLISIAAHATWYGFRWGRSALLTLLTVVLGLLIVQSVMYIDWAADAGFLGRAVTAAWFRTGLSLAWLALNFIFLFRKRARMFFA
jgi:hypothetical protein